jgi:hypothetical protein
MYQIRQLIGILARHRSTSSRGFSPKSVQTGVPFAPSLGIRLECNYGGPLLDCTITNSRPHGGLFPVQPFFPEFAHGLCQSGDVQ